MSLSTIILTKRSQASGETVITEYRSTVLIFNPRAGKFGRSGSGGLDRAMEILQRDGHTVTVAPTTGPGTAGEIARTHIAQGASLIIAAGGDGTINEVVEGMVHSGVPLAILPGGTANVLATELKLGYEADRAAERLAELRPHRIAVGHLTCDGGRVSRHFLLMAGVGLDAHIVYHVNHSLKNRTGKFAYWLAGWSLFGKSLAEFTVELNGRRRKCSFALVSRVRNYGGDFEIARGVTLLENQFEVVHFEGRSTLRYAKFFAGMVFNSLNGMKGISVERTDRVVLANATDRRVYIQIDGEFAGHLPAEIRIVPEALTVLLPAEYVNKGGRRTAATDQSTTLYTPQQ